MTRIVCSRCDGAGSDASGARCQLCNGRGTARGFTVVDREIAAHEADIYKAKRNARVAKKGGLR